MKVINSPSFKFKIMPTKIPSPELDNLRAKWKNAKDIQSNSQFRRIFEVENSNDKKVSFKAEDDLLPILFPKKEPDVDYCIQFHLGVDNNDKIVPFVTHGKINSPKLHSDNAYYLNHDPSENLINRLIGYGLIAPSGPTAIAAFEGPRVVWDYIKNWKEASDALRENFEYTELLKQDRKMWLRHFTMEDKQGTMDYSEANKFYYQDPSKTELYLHFGKSRFERGNREEFSFVTVIDIRRKELNSTSDHLFFERISPCPPACWPPIKD